MDKVKRTERGWAGHFICCYRCDFRRNTLLEYKDIAIVVSTVGLMRSTSSDDLYETIGYERYYETMAFHTDKKDTKYKDIDVEKEVNFDSDWRLNETDVDDKANEMHERAVNEITKKLKKGYLFE